MTFDLLRLLKYATEQGCSDLHITVGQPPIVRARGELRWVKHDPLTSDEVHEAIYGILAERQIAQYEQDLQLDFGWRIAGVGRFRTNIYNHYEGEGAAFRIIPEKIKSLDDLLAPEAVYGLARKKAGLVLVTGPSGSGKSTTQAAMVDLINQESRGHILTIEDPIEYVHESRSCLVTQREIGTHAGSFSAALRAGLREDPDFILIGEMRDLDTISMALTAAETGNLVVGTLQTRTAADVANRIIDVFPAGRHNQIRSMLAHTLQGVIAQQLVPDADGKGRVAVMEIMLANSAVRNMIRESKTAQLDSAIQTGLSEGMQSFDQALLSRYETGRITLKTGLEFANDKPQFEKWARNVTSPSRMTNKSSQKQTRKEADETIS